MNAIPRVALVWLLVAQVLVILPHLAYMPLWIAAMWLGCAAWRVQVFRMRAGYPRAWVKLALALLAGAGVWLSRGSLVGLDAGAVLLIAAFILKLVEMKTRRDALVLVFLGFFAVVVGYLFDDGFLAALYSLLPVTALLAALIGLQQSAFASRPWPTLRLAGGLLLQALPLMLLLFLFFPPGAAVVVADARQQGGHRTRRAWRQGISPSLGAPPNWRSGSASRAHRRRASSSTGAP